MKTGKRVFVYKTDAEVMDKYTVAATIANRRYFFAMGDDPYSPLGFNLFIGDSRQYTECSKCFGRKLSYIPMHLVRAIKERITY